MTNWKRLIVSGSDASLKSLAISGGDVIIDDGDRLAIGNANPLHDIHIGSASGSLVSPAADIFVNNDGRADIVLRNSLNDIEFSLSAGEVNNFFIARGDAGMSFVTAGAGAIAFDAGSGTDEVEVTNGVVDINGRLDVNGQLYYSTQGSTATSLVGRDSTGKLTTDVSGITSGFGGGEWGRTGTTIYYNSGSVGIDTETPTTLLEVSGTFKATDNSSIGGEPSSVATFRIVRGESVPKVWTDAAFYANTPLVIERNDNAYVTFLGSSSKTSGFVFSDEDAWLRGSMIYKHATDMLVFRAGGTETLWNRNGNVGIKTDDPQASLDVGGDTDETIHLGRAKFGSYVTDYMYLSHFDNGSGTNYAIKQAAGGSTTVNAASGQDVELAINNDPILGVYGATNRVGINTNTPTASLHVSGGAHIDGDTSMIGGLQINAVSPGESTHKLLTWNSLGGAVTYSTSSLNLDGGATMTIERPVTNYIDYPIFRAPYDLTISEVNAVIYGGTSVDALLVFGTDRSNLTSKLISSSHTVDSATVGNTLTSFSTASMPMDSFLICSMSSNVGSVQLLTISVKYKKD
jgi:hypothetical protein